MEQLDPLAPEVRAFLALTRAAPFASRQFHAIDLIRKIGAQGYEARVAEVIRQFACPCTASVAAHGQAVTIREIGR